MTVEEAMYWARREALEEGEDEGGCVVCGIGPRTYDGRYCGLGCARRDEEEAGEVQWCRECGRWPGEVETMELGVLCGECATELRGKEWG
jgi:hypothetical protein